MSGNALFLVCQPCEQADEPDFGVRMAERSEVGWYEHSVPTKQFDAWLAKHRKCGGPQQPGPLHLGPPPWQKRRPDARRQSHR